jgi:light-harvesting complex I chlorophyll a/b binding protein 4
MVLYHGVLARDLTALPAQVNLGGLLAWEFLLFHWVEVRRWQDIRKKDSVNEVPPACCTLWHAPP